MKKSLLKLAVGLLTLAAIPFSAHAAEAVTFDVSIGKIHNANATLKYKVVSESPAEVAVYGYSWSDSGAGKTDYTLTIPATVTNNGTTYTVTSIANNFGYGLTRMTKLVLPASLTKIGNSCFSNCSRLKSIDMGGVTEIGDRSFGRCTALETLDLSKVTSIDVLAFYDCTALTSVTLSPDLENLNGRAFEGCTNLNLTLPEECLYVIIDNVLYRKASKAAGADPVHLASLTSKFNATSFAVPATVTSMDGAVFKNNTTLQSVDLGGNLTSIPSQTFWGCKALKSVTGIEKVESLGYYAFYQCAALEEFHVGPALTSIAIVNPGDAANEPRDNCAFLACPNLSLTVDEANPVYSSIDGHLLNKAGDEFLYYVGDRFESYSIPEGVTSVADFAINTGQLSALNTLEIAGDVSTIGDYACGKSDGNSSVTRLILGDKVTTVGARAFQQLQGLTSVRSRAMVPPALGTEPDYAFYYNVPTNAKLIVPSAAKAAYAEAAGWKKFSANITTGITDAAIDTDADAPVEYYNLQGVRVAEPAAGQIVIRRQGNRAEKVLVR